MSKLLTKIEGNENFKSKISQNTNNLALTPESTTPKTFADKSKATADLKAWCQKKTKDETEKIHEDELCREQQQQQVGWLFSN